MNSNSFITDTTPAGDFEKLTVSTTVVTPTASKLLVNQAGGFHKRAVRVDLSVETNTIHYRFDGGVPDATTGMVAVANAYVTIIGEANVQRLQMIRASADATVHLTYYYNI